MELRRLWICALVVQALLLAPAYTQTAEEAPGSLPSNFGSGAAAAGRELLAARKKAPAAKKKTPPKAAPKKKPAPKGKPAGKAKKPAVKTTNALRKPTPGSKAPATSRPAPVPVVSETDEILALHNYSRARHGVSPLMWDYAASVWATSWAKQCIWGHNSSDPFISNIAMTYPDWASVYKTWYDDEVDLYDWNAATYSDRTGHFTAIVWKATTGVGCGKAWCTNMPIGSTIWTGYYYVCNYTPPGNMIGAFRENVLPVLPTAKKKQQG